MIDSIYHMTLKLIKKSHFWRENGQDFVKMSQWMSYVTLRNLYTTSVFY